MSQGTHSIRKRSPILTGIAGLLFVAAAVFVTPHFLIRSGLLQGSLANVEPDVRAFGYVGMAVVRILTAVVGACVLVASVGSILSRKRHGSEIKNRESPQESGYAELAGSFLNRSFGLMFLVWLGVLLLVVFGQQILEKEVFLRINREVVPRVAGLGFLIAAGLGCGLALRFSKIGRGRVIGGIALAATMAAVGFGLLRMRAESGVLFGLVATDMLTVLILGYFAISLLLRNAPFFGGQMDQLGILSPTVGLLLGSLFAVTVSTPVMGSVWGVPEGVETGFLRLLLLSAGSVVLMGETRLQIRGSHHVSPHSAERGVPKVEAPSEISA